MATEPVLSVTLTDFAAGLVSEREVGPRAQIIAQKVFHLIPKSAVVVYVIEHLHEPTWGVKASLGDLSLDPRRVPFESGTLGILAKQRRVLQFGAAELAREDYAHLDIRQSFHSLVYVPIQLGEELLGCIEVVCFDSPLPPGVLKSFQPLIHLSALALAAAQAYESERNASLRSITRLMQLYDIEKVFSATLDMENLWSLICSKVQELTSATGVNLWMIDKDNLLLLLQNAGVDPSSAFGAQESERKGLAGKVSSSGEPILLGEDDPMLIERNQKAGDTPIISIMVVPLLDGESLVGVLEVLSCDPALQFDEDDLFTLVEVASSAAQALHNASLLEAERKVEILHTLVSVSQEIASTLNQDRVLQAIVNQPQRVIPYDRAAIALEERGALRIKAVSGMLQLNPDDPDIVRLQTILRWALGLQQEILVTRHGNEINDPRPETQEKFLRYFEETKTRGFYAIPLVDEEGRLGILSFESTDPDFLTEAHLEIIKVIASQATVALRNASLYKEVPFIGILEPMLEKKRKFMALEKRRRTIAIASVAAILLFLVLVPMPMRVEGEAQVAPTRTDYLRANSDGILESVFVREGDQVKRGALLAQMQDWEQRSDVARSQARYNAALQEMNRALSMNDGSLAGRRRVEADYWRNELDRSRDKLEATKLRARIDGTVATPHVEDMAGKKLIAGNPVLELVDTSNVTVDVAIPERDIALVRPGAAARLKLQSFSSRTFPGQVVIVSPQGTVQDDGRIFYARVLVHNDARLIRSGMLGRSKIGAGWHPAGYVLFRNTGMWVWSKLWSWVGW